jgi:hypothetical protein
MAWRFSRVRLPGWARISAWLRRLWGADCFPIDPMLQAVSQDIGSIAMKLNVFFKKNYLG